MNVFLLIRGMLSGWPSLKKWGRHSWYGASSTSITEVRFVEANDSSSGLELTTSPALSNMLSERRYCLRGLTKGFDGRLWWCDTLGDACLLSRPLRLPKDCFNLGGGASMAAEGLTADFGRRSCGGDSRKHSPRVIEVEVDNIDGFGPAPKRKAGGWCMSCLGRVLVEYPFWRLRDGLRKPDFLRLHWRLACEQGACSVLHTRATMESPNSTEERTPSSSHFHREVLVMETEPRSASGMVACVEVEKCPCVRSYY